MSAEAVPFHYGDGATANSLAAIGHPWANKFFAEHYGFDSGDQFLRRAGFKDVAVPTGAQGGLSHGGFYFQRQEKYFGIRGDVTNLAGSGDAIEMGKADVQENEIGLKLLSFLDGLKAVRRHVDHVEPAILLEMVADRALPIDIIIYEKNADNR